MKVSLQQRGVLGRLPTKLSFSRSLSYSFLYVCATTVMVVLQSTSQARADTDVQPAQMVAISNVSVIPMDSPRLLPGKTVTIENGRITAVADAKGLELPDHATVIDGSGRFLMPGLADMHAHIYGFNDEQERAKNQEVARNQLLVYVATGVTLVRDAGGSTGHFDYQRNVSSRDWVGPDLFVASPIFEGEKNVWDFSIKVTDVDQARSLVKKYAAQGYWGLKVYHTVSPDVYGAIIKGAEELDLPVMGHVPFDVGIDRTLASGITSIEHLRGYDFDGVPVESLWSDGGRSYERFSSWNSMEKTRRDELVSATKQNGVWNAPTLQISRFLFDKESRAAVAEHPRFGMIHPVLQATILGSSSLDDVFPPESTQALKEAYPVMQQFVKALNDAGAGLLVGTDYAVAGYVPGFTAIDEIQSFGEAGLTNFEALSAATTGPAHYLGLADERGTVATGMRADLILLNANPLEDLAALWELEGVVLNGSWHSLDSLESQLSAQKAGWE